MTRERALAAFDLALALVMAAVIAWGVLVPGWSPFVVLLLFWFENVVIGAFNVAKMLATGLRLGAAGLLSGRADLALMVVGRLKPELTLESANVWYRMNGSKSSTPPCTSFIVSFATSIVTRSTCSRSDS